MRESADHVPGDFVSWRSYWNFAREVSREFRYLHSPETKAFLEAVKITSESRRVEIPKHQLFWRAQIGHDWCQLTQDTDEQVPCAHPPDRMKPRTFQASDGRANPRGIPSLYLATSQKAAISEVRPWIGSSVSCAQFRVNRSLTVVDCARGQNERPFFFQPGNGIFEPDHPKRSKAVWAHIDRAFAEPITRTDDLADYVPTQILAELFKQSGADGVVYKSNFGEDSFNISLFDPSDADLVNCGLFEVEAVEIRFKQTDSPYYIQETLANPTDFRQ